MPKIIPDLHNRILDSAANLFSTVGYTTTDMKAISTDLGISVGTLYNYFPSKPELFMAVTLRWRSELINTFRAIALEPENARDRLCKILRSMLTNAQTFTGIWKEFMASEPKELKDSAAWSQHKNMDSSEQAFFEDVRELLREILATNPLAQPLIDDPKNRFVMMLFMPLLNLVMRYPSEAPDNMNFLNNWINFLFPEEKTL